ncbi:TRAP transporter substrate-binding protein DctP [Roseicitreum antarcticum]|uniref:TRAP-type C4-dicarboxylate transport system, substrate-binding protein n=1 Tax=Roseicitreum antarcticum TaxID=564137 RepID=A0A1H2UJU0_9RHOB|nr:TRAP transporter substrate-binding protein DctP [Roseicitreum antarcticum]SDW56423.1 TRAP-type C4-dicarboxylate transport system, substrate-binding protein [Roseicitreum antarcticum]
MSYSFTRRVLLQAGAAATALCALGAAATAQDRIQLRMSTVATESDQRTVALEEAFGPGVAEFASYEPHYNGTLFRQATELDAIARGNLEMAITSAQELAEFFPEFSVFTAGYLHRDAAHQVAVFNDPLMDPFKQKVEDELGVKLLTVMYLGRRHVNLRTEEEVQTPEDLAGITLRMPGTEAWLFLGSALGANPVPMAFGEVYTGLQTGAIDGQDNPLPTVRDSRFYEVTKQIVLTSHLVDLNYLAISKATWDAMTPEQQEATQAAADAAAEVARNRQLALEDELADFFRAEGLSVYEPDVEAFRTHVQAAYLASEFANDWPEGIVDAVNAAGN